MRAWLRGTIDRMTRWAWRLCVFLLLGAIVNVAVVLFLVLVVRGVPEDHVKAWESWDAGVEWRVRRWTNSTLVAINSKRIRRPEVVDGPLYPNPYPIVVGSADMSALPLWAASMKRPTAEFACGDIDIEERVRLARGWPYVSMWLELVEMKGGPPQFDVEGGWKLGDSWDGDLLPPCMPYRPAIAGFAINTVFYAAILWGLFAAPFALRRWRRIKRGLCPKCAYDLRASESPACPECGATIRPASAPDTMPARTSAPSA